MKKIFLLLSIILLTSLSATAAELYAVLSNNDRTLTIYYDGSREQRQGLIISEVNNSQNNLPWYSYAAGIIKVCFDPTMTDFSFSSDDTGTAYWFHGFTNLTTIEGLEYLNTKNATSMRNMFYGCESLSTLDLSMFRTPKVNDMTSMFQGCTNLITLDIINFDTSELSSFYYMFKDCTNLRTIYNNSGSNHFSRGELNTPMFEGCEKLVGGSGFTYSPDCVTSCYATAEESGYFTMLPYAKLSLEGILTFYYDTHYAGYLINRRETPLKPFDSKESRGWNNSSPYITKVVFDESMAKCHTITSTAYWLAGMTNLTTIEGLEKLNTENVTEMKYMFTDCQSITTIDLTGFNTAKVTDMEKMFYNCNKLKTIYCNDSWMPQNSSDMFMGCIDLVGGSNFRYSNECVTADYASPSEQGYFTKKAVLYVTLSNNNQTLTFYYDNDRVSQNGMSYGPFTQGRRWIDKDTYHNITKVIFDESMADCTTITSTAYWFSDFSNLATITGLENLNTTNVTNMGHMFASCTSLTSLDLNGFNTANVTNMTFMFLSCRNLKTIYCDNTWIPIDESNGMFLDCTSLVGGQGFTHSDLCHNAEYANPGEQGYFTKRVPYALLSGDNKTLTFYYGIKPADGLDVGPFTSSSRRAWHENDVSITKVEFDKSMEKCTSITSTAYWFSGLFNLTEIEGLKYLNTENVTDMKYMFNDCKKLTSIELNGFKTAKVTDMSSMFYNCQELTSLDVSGFNTAEVTDMNKMFYLCMKLTSLDVSGFNTAKVTNMSNMFCNCGVTTIYCDDDWYNPDITSDYMFDGCWNLVGGSGFGFDEDYVTVEYANPGEQGYFTMKTYMKGDVNGDGKVTPADAIMILYHYFNVNQNGFKIQAADLNGDGNITPADAIETLYKYFGNGNHNARATRPTTSDSHSPE